jgi:hypothetical protein
MREPLTTREREILDHVLLYRITVREAVARQLFSGEELLVADRALEELRRAGHLRAYELYPHRKYWMLSPEAAAARQLDAGYAKPLAPEVLVRTFGVLAFCCLGPTPRRRLSLESFRTRFPDLYKPQLPSSWYYVDSEHGQERLGYIIVDFASDAMRLVRRVRKAVAQRLGSGLPSFAALIRNGEFTVTIVTAHDEKKARLAGALKKEGLDVVRHIEVHHDLVHLVGLRHRPQLRRKRAP